MRVYISASKDATIYQRYPDFNAGLDEILEVGKIKKPTDITAMFASGSARSLISFDITSSNAYPTSSKYFLRLYIATAKDINRYQTLEIYPVSKSWDEGSGYFYQDIQNAYDGVTWKERTPGTLWANSGSDYATSPAASYTFSSTPIQDIKVDVTSIIAPVISGSNTTPWNGLLLKFPTSAETSSLNKGILKFFSSNTHTIFSPKLEVVWVTQSFATGSLKPIPGSNISIVPKNLKEAYTQGEKDKIYFVVRDLYPDKKFDTVQRYKSMYYLPSQSYYRIVDEVSNIKLHDFDEYSTLNCDASGSYINLDTSALDTERYYRLELKVVKDNLVFFPKAFYSFKIDADG